MTQEKIEVGEIVRRQAEWCQRHGAEYVTGITTADLLAALEQARAREVRLVEALEECRLIVANLPHDEDLLLRKIDQALEAMNIVGGGE